MNMQPPQQLSLRPAPRPLMSVSRRSTRACTSPASPRVLLATPATAPSCTHHHDSVVVIGSGMSGLAAAKVLSQHFSSVRVLERDTIPQEWTGQAAIDVYKIKGARRGVAQPQPSQPPDYRRQADPQDGYFVVCWYNHLHVLVAEGVQTLDRLFEGRFVPTLRQRGAVLNDIVTNFHSYHPVTGRRWATPAVAAKGPLLFCQASRHLVESAARQLVQDSPGVDFIYGAAVSGLMLQEQDSNDGRSGAPHHKVTGVLLADGSQLAADLVVDCSGRQSQMPQWLAAAGLGAPRAAEVNADLGYASWLVKLDPDVAARTLAGKKGAYVIAAYPESIGASVIEVEDGLHMVVICTYGGDAPPFKDDQLMGFMAEKTWHPIVAHVLEGAVPVTRTCRFHRVSSTWRHYEEVALPDGLLVMADAVCSFNPVWGHGMTVAALEADKLGKLLAARQVAAAGSEEQQSWLAGLSQEYQQAITPIIQRVWDLSAGSDMRFSSTTSTEPPSPVSGFLNTYFDSLMVLAGKDPEVTEQLLRNMHLVDDASELTSPHMLGKVLRHTFTAPFVKLWQGMPNTGSTSI